MYDVAIIGAGVIGGAIARELSRYALSIVILEKENDISAGASKANSGIVHAGYDPEENTLMAALNVQGNRMYDKMCEELSVPFQRNGSLVLAFDGAQLSRIAALKRRGDNNGVPGLELLSGEELRALEPAVSPDAKGALYAKTAGITDPMLLTVSMIENAVMNGADCFLNFEVAAIKKEDGYYRLFAAGGQGQGQGLGQGQGMGLGLGQGQGQSQSQSQSQVETKCVVNAAGVFSDKVHDMAAQPAYRITPRRGQYFLLDKEDGDLVRSTLFPCPTEAGKGVLVAPSVHGNLLLGPASDSVLDGDDTGTTDEALASARAGARLLVPKASTRNTIRTFAGVRAEADAGDFIIKEADGSPGFIDVAGIKSPGLSAAPAIALRVASLIEETGLALERKEDFDPIVRRMLLKDMPEECQAALIAENPLYGRVVCRCETITEGDIVDSINRPVGATTLDAVKRRCRAGMGRCQGGFCGPKVQQILARELNKPLPEIMLEGKASYILTGRTK